MAAAFSYAQAAKGQSAPAPSIKAPSTAPSGTASPPSTALTETPSASSVADHTEHPQSHASAQKTSATSETPASGDQAKASSRPTNRIHDGASSIDTDSVNDSVMSRDAKSDTKPETKTPSLDIPALVAAATEEADKSLAGEDGEAQAKAPAKTVLQEARPPTVNIWAQRAAELKSKLPARSPPQSSAPASQQPGPSTSRHSVPNAAVATPADNEKQKQDYRRKSEQGLARELRRGDMTGRPRDDVKSSRTRRDAPRADEPTSLTRRTPPKPRDRANSEVAPPSVNSTVAWPTPEDAQSDDKKRQDDKDRSGSISKPHGKTEWKHMPYTPTAIFETRIEGKAGPRVGKGSAKPGLPLNTRASTTTPPTAAENVRTPTKPGLPNGDRSGTQIGRGTAEPEDSQRVGDTATSVNGITEPSKSYQESSKFGSGAANDVGITEGASEASQKLSHLASKAASSPLQLDASRNFEPTSNGVTSKRVPGHVQTEAIVRSNYTSELNSQTPRSAHTERRSEPHIYDNSHRDSNPFRETGKRGGRKGPGRGGFGNGPFGSPNNFTNGFQDFGGPHVPGLPSGNFYQTRGMGRGYRNQALRSQSIPIDTSFTRPMTGYAGYPMAPMPSYGPDYYAGPFSAGPIPGGPQMDREYLIASVLHQVEYYFSIDNLLKDIFLRKHMDSQGWIELQVVARFNRMKSLTTDYDVLKTACLQSGEIEIRVGDDGKERLRKVNEWKQWVLPLGERDAAAQHDGFSNLRQISPVRGPAQEHWAIHSPGRMHPHAANRVMPHSFHIQDGASAPFFPGTLESTTIAHGSGEEIRGRQDRAPLRAQSVIFPPSTGFPESAEDAEPDRFPTSQIENLSVLVRKCDGPATRPNHNASSRTFSNGSIKSGDLIDSVSESVEATAPMSNGVHPHEEHTSVDDDHHQIKNNDKGLLDLFWVKDKDQPIDGDALPIDTTHELYTALRSKALAQREAASTGNCPYDLDVLYQFWSHFLVRNFNSRMYQEFKTLANDDAQHRHSDSGLESLIAFYNGALASQISARDSVVDDFAKLIKSEAGKGSRPAFDKVRESWLNHTYNLKNRKKLGDLLDESIRAELES